MIVRDKYKDLLKNDNLRASYLIVYEDDKMIGVDVDQVYGIMKLSINELIYGKKYCYSERELAFSPNTQFIPKEIYNIISVKQISLVNIKNKLVIGDKIINLYNIHAIFVNESPNIIMSRKILNLPLYKFFSFESKNGITWIKDESYKQFVIDCTTIPS